MGDSELQVIIDRIRALGTLPEEVAKEAAQGVGDAVRATAAAGRSPDGQEWAIGKNGKRVLVNAAAAVECHAVGATVLLELVGTSTGDARAQAIQNATRRILPEPGAPLPKPILSALSQAGDRVFARVTGGR